MTLLFRGHILRFIHPNTAIEMNNKQHCSIQSRYSPAARALSFVLLAFVLYGSTVEAAHRHGQVLKSNGQTSSSVQDSSQSDQGVSGNPSCSDCLICQLHQNFSSALTSFALLDVPTPICTSISCHAGLAVDSQYCTPRRGRAPPSAS